MNYPHFDLRTVTPTTKADMAVLSGWLRLSSIITIAITALNVAVVVWQLSNDVPMQVQEYMSFLSYAINIGLAIINLRAAAAFKRFNMTSNPFDLEAAFKSQRDYFMLLGVWVILMILMLVLVFVFAGAMAGGMGRF